MNKKTKGLIAGAVGAGLLLGAGGTFALWFDTVALGTTGDRVATGNLALYTSEPVEGQWVWERTSAGQNWIGQPFAGPTYPEGRGGWYIDDVTGEWTYGWGAIVPGDALRYEWCTDQIGLLLIGDSLVASLYLDGVGYLSPSDIAPLTLDVYGENNSWHLGPITNLDGIDAPRGSFLLIPGITPGNADSQFGLHRDPVTNLSNFTLPSIVLSFDADPAARRDPFGIGHRPEGLLQDGEASTGYGRDRYDVLSGWFNPAGLQIRLQQDLIASVTEIATALANANQMKTTLRVAVYHYHRYGVTQLPQQAIIIPRMYETVAAWLNSATPAEIYEWVNA